MRYITELAKEDRPVFVKFLTGSKRLPSGGFRNLQPNLTMAWKQDLGYPDSHLPSVMACQNYLKVPKYSSYEVLKARFDYAARECTNSFTLS